MSNLYIDPGPSGPGKVMLATTAYDAPCAGYTFSMARTREACHKAGLPTAYLLLSGNCHVDDARNSVVQEFLLSDSEALLFIDADVSWEPDAVIRICSHDVDLVGGVYPFRRDDEASKQNMPVLMMPDVHDPDENGLIEVLGLPSGFMRIRRNVLETLSETADKHWKKTDRRSKVPILFERTYRDGLRVGGDISFCAKWVEAGGKVYADYDLHLGHTGQTTQWDSLGAGLRRQANRTLSYMVERIRAGKEDARLFQEVRRAVGNGAFAALEDGLWAATAQARKCEGPILEMGSGISTIAMAAATENTVWCVEHDPAWAAQTEAMARRAGVSNIAMVTCPIVDDWYGISDEDRAEMPKRFGFAFVDGPPRVIASRMGFYSAFGDVCRTILVDDADDPGYADALRIWAQGVGRKIDFVEGGRTAVIR